MTFYLPIVLMILGMTFDHIAQKSVHTSDQSGVFADAELYECTRRHGRFGPDLFVVRRSAVVYEEYELGKLRGRRFDSRSGTWRSAGLSGRVEDQPGFRGREHRYFAPARNDRLGFLSRTPIGQKSLRGCTISPGLDPYRWTLIAAGFVKTECVRLSALTQ